MDRKDSYTQAFLKAAGKEHDEKTIKQFRSIWWYSTRGKDVGGLRLTDLGIEFVETQADIKTYTVDFPKDLTIGPQILIWLDQYIDSPFHLQKKKMKVLSERAAFELYLFSGDIKKLGLNKTLAKRMSQESSSDNT
jgi:hypothetical protein